MRLRLAILLLVVTASTPVRAQSAHDVALAAARNSHYRMAPSRPATAADSARAAWVVETLRSSIAKYADVHAAEADGYHWFGIELQNEGLQYLTNWRWAFSESDGFRQLPPHLWSERVYHYTNRRWAFAEMFRFDPAHPSSLLYATNQDGSLRLVGAMYITPGHATAEDADARIPTSIAHWHRHVNFCIPTQRRPDRWYEQRDGLPLFGPMSPIATREACAAAGGILDPQVMGWMVHANVFAGDDPKVIWKPAGH